MSKHSSEACVEIPISTGPAVEHPLPLRVWSSLKCFGPAAILASMSIGAGETIVVVRTGAWAGYDLLWVVMLSCLVKGVFVTYMLGRYTAISGESVGSRLVRLPGPRGWFLLAIVGAEVLFAPLAWVAIARPCGNLVQYLVGYDFLAAFAGDGSSAAWCENVYTTLFIAAALGVSLTLTYERLERQQILICGVLVLGTLIGTMMVWPDFGAAVKGTLLRIGRLPESVPHWAPEDARAFPLLNLATVFAYVGGSVTGYVAYANWIGIRGWGLTGHSDIDRIRERASRSPRIDYLPDDEEQRLRLRRLAAPLRWDISLGAIVLFFVTATFMVAGAAALYDQQSSFSGWRLLTDQAYIWRSIHPWIVPVYYVTVIAALWGTLTALPEIYSRVTHEFFSAIWPRRRWSYLKIRKVIVLTILIGSVFIIWADLEFDTLIQIVGFLVVNLAVAAIAVAAFYLNHKLPPAYRTRPQIFVCALVSVVILAVAASMSFLGLARKLRDRLAVPESVKTSEIAPSVVHWRRIGIECPRCAERETARGWPPGAALRARLQAGRAARSAGDSPARRIEATPRRAARRALSAGLARAPPRQAAEKSRSTSSTPPLLSWRKRYDSPRACAGRIEPRGTRSGADRPGGDAGQLDQHRRLRKTQGPSGPGHSLANSQPPLHDR